MKLQELYEALSNVLPAGDWQVEQDNYGQLVIYTGLTCDEDENLLFFECEEDE